MNREKICANCEHASYEAGLYRNERTCHRPDGTERLVPFDRSACDHFHYKCPHVKIVEIGELKTYEFYCNICGTRFQARVDECDSVTYTLGVPFVNIHCPFCKINSCSRRADDYIREKKKEEE